MGPAAAIGSTRLQKANAPPAAWLSTPWRMAGSGVRGADRGGTCGKADIRDMKLSSHVQLQGDAQPNTLQCSIIQCKVFAPH